MNLEADLSNFSQVFSPPGPGLFLTFEGVEGSGKSTQIQKLADLFTDLSREVLLLREPGGTDFGEKLRATILGQTVALDPLSETFVFLASRTQLLQEKVLPFLANPKAVVLLDRYIDSTLVYQALAINRPLENIWKLHQFAPLNTLPHATFFLDIDVEVSLERQAARGQAKDYFESRHKDFQTKLVDGYRHVASLYPGRIQRIDATSSPEEVFNAIKNVLIARGKI
ncbi:MAG: dTMP kinase [Bacteriovoracia bacterium]